MLPTSCRKFTVACEKQARPRSGMKRIASHLIGIDQGDLMLFSDYEDDGEMWTGEGARERVVPVIFATAPEAELEISCTAW